jgi:hypothetical protein
MDGACDNRNKRHLLNAVRVQAAPIIRSSIGFQ